MFKHKTDGCLRGCSRLERTCRPRMEGKAWSKRPFWCRYRVMCGDRPGNLVHRRRAPAHRGRSAAPRPRPRHDAPSIPPRCTVTPRPWSARQSPGGAMTCSSSPRFLPTTPPCRGRWRPASARSRACAPTGWTVTCCTGLARIPVGGTLRRLRAAPRTRQDPVLGGEQLRMCPTSKPPGRPGRGASPATRFSTTWRSVQSSTPSSPGARITAIAVRRYSHSAMAASWPTNIGRPRPG